MLRSPMMRMARTAAPKITISPYSRIALATMFGLGGCAVDSSVSPSIYSVVPGFSRRKDGLAGLAPEVLNSSMAPCPSGSIALSPCLGADFQMNSRILNHIETRSNTAGIQHAAARSVAELKVSLSGAGMMYMLFALPPRMGLNGPSPGSAEQ